jgi:glycerol-3-phosphate dehydrogenase (NAD(P)+)
MNITIFGAGAYGQALAYLAQKNHHTVVFYDKKSAHPTLPESLKNAEAIILAIPSAVIPEILKEIPENHKTTPLILASKGLFSLEIFKNFPNFSVLSGPGFADDLMADQPAALTATSQLAVDLFETTEVKIELSQDPLGVAICGPLKNIYAIGGGFLGVGSNTASTDDFLSAAVAEMKVALKLMGANPATADLSCGIGDLKLTTTSGRSRNYTLGQEIAAGKSIKPEQSQTLEGLTALQNLPEKLKVLPLIDTISKIVKIAEMKTTKTTALNNREK